MVDNLRLNVMSEVVSPDGIDLVQSSAKHEDARLSSSGRANLEAEGREWW